MTESEHRGEVPIILCYVIYPPETDPEDEDSMDLSSDQEGETQVGPENELSHETEGDDVEDSGGCNQNKTSRATYLYLLCLAGVISCFSRRRRLLG